MIISKNIRVRCPDDFLVGEYAIIDDFCYFSTKVDIGFCSHIANNCTIAGGKDFLFKVGKYGGLASGVRIFCASDDFVHDAACVFPEDYNKLKTHTISGNVILGDYVTIGANSVVMPNQNIPEGVVIGALSLVPVNFEFDPWTVYAGNRIRAICKRDKDSVLSSIEKLERLL